MKRTVVSHGERLEYTLVRSGKKSILMKALPGGEFRVWAPKYASLKTIDNTVIAHMDELKRMADQLEHAIAKNRSEHPMTEGRSLCVEGRVYRLHLEQSARWQLTLTEDICNLRGPAVSDEESVRAALKHELVQLAMKRIAERLTEYAPIIGVRYGRVTIREQKTRWGSCSSKHNLNFNWKLIMAPPEALTYVVIHELCHLIEFSHSPKFWQLVGRYMPEYEYWKKWLKDHGRELTIGD